MVSVCVYVWEGGGGVLSLRTLQVHTFKYYLKFAISTVLGVILPLSLQQKQYKGPV